MAILKLASIQDTIPVVADTTARDARFPSPALNQRVDVISLGAIQRWNGSSWVTHLGLATSATFIALGTNPAAAGAIRLPNAAEVRMRNQGNSGDLRLVQSVPLGGGDERVIFGNASIDEVLFDGGLLGFYTAGTVRWLVDNSGHFIPGGAGFQNLDIGGASNGVRTVYVKGSLTVVGSTAFAGRGLGAGPSVSSLSVNLSSGAGANTYIGLSPGGNLRVTITDTEIFLYNDLILNLGVGGKVVQNGVDVIAPTPAPGWGAPSGTASRATFDTATVTLAQLAGRVMALIQDLRQGGAYHGLLSS